jgi:HEAT repeat protein
VEAAWRLWVEHQHTEALAGIMRAARVDKSVAVRATAVRALATLPERDIRALGRELAEALNTEKDGRVRGELARIVGRHEELARLAVDGLIQALRDPDPAVRATAAESLAVAGAVAKSAAAELVELLQDKEGTVRRAAVRALGRIEPAGAVAVAETLAGLLSREHDRDVRWEIVSSLDLLNEKPPAVIQALGQLLQQQNDGELRLRALRVLAKFGPAARAAIPQVWQVARTDPLKQVRREAVHAFAALLGSELPTRLADLLSLLQDADFEVRIAVLEEVATLGPALQKDTHTLRLIRARLSDPHVKVREAAAATLKRIEHPPMSQKSDK